MLNPSKIAELSDGRTVEIIRKAKHKSRVRYLGGETFLVQTEEMANIRVKPELLQEPGEKVLPVEPTVEPVPPQEISPEGAGLVAPPITGPVTTEEIEAFQTACQAVVDAHHTENFPTQYSRLDLSEGRRYFKLISCSGMVGISVQGEESSKSAWCFVDKDNGDVLKPADWKKPAKHARGNLRDESQGLGSIGPYGPAYLR